MKRLSWAFGLVVIATLVVISIAGCGGEAITATLAPSPKTAASATPTTLTPGPTLTIYTVQQGDTLGEIAARNQTSVEAIAAANNISDTNRIEIGQQLVIPPTSLPTQTTPIPTRKVATRAVSPTPLPTVVTKRTTPEIDWGGICPPSPKNEGQVVGNLEIGSTVRIEGHLYVKPSGIIRNKAMPFTLRAVSYYGTGWSRECRLHVFIPIGTGPNQVGELPKKFKFTDVVVWDKDGREIRGFQRSLDSHHVRVVGEVIKAYGGETGLSGSNTIRLIEITLLE